MVKNLDGDLACQQGWAMSRPKKNKSRDPFASLWADAICFVVEKIFYNNMTAATSALRGPAGPL